MSDTPSSPNPEIVRALLPTGELFSRARAIIHSNLFSILIMNALFGGFVLLINTVSLVVVMQVLVGELEWTYRQDYQNALLMLLSLPLIAYGSTGLLQFYTRLARGEKPRWTILFQYHRGYLHMLLFWLCYYVLYFFLVRVAVRGVVEPFKYDIEILIRMGAGVLFFLWVFVRLVFAPLFIVDGRSNLRQAARRSWMLTSGRSRRTAWLTFFFFLVGALGFLFAGIGVLYSFAVTMLAYVMIFDRLSHPETTAN